MSPYRYEQEREWLIKIPSGRCPYLQVRGDSTPLIYICTLTKHPDRKRRETCFCTKEKCPITEGTPIVQDKSGYFILQEDDKCFTDGG